MHYQYRFNEFFDALSCILDLDHGSRQGAHPFLGVVVSALLELDASSGLVLDLLNHFSVLADDYTDGRSRHRHLRRGKFRVLITTAVFLHQHEQDALHKDKLIGQLYVTHRW